VSLAWAALVATVLVGVGTYLTRASFILALADRDLPRRLRTALSFVAPAVMAALVVSLTVPAEAGEPLWVEGTALVVGGVAGWVTRSLIWVLVAGMATLWLLRWMT
jgi:branched-subunit amino acid transport protein